MPRKWDGPLQPPPVYLDPAWEVTQDNDTPHPPNSVLLPLLTEGYLHLGCPLKGALEITANTVSEIGWESKYRANNLGGWKTSADWARTYAAEHGHPARWYRAHGNIDSGDPQTVFYRGYDSIEQYQSEWRRKFIPKPSEIPPPPTKGSDPYRYRATGAAFWAGRPWFPELVKAGYKGPVTQANPSGSIAAHENLTREVSEWWAQSRLRGTIADKAQATAFSIDGKWGLGSASVCRLFQKAHGLTPTGALDFATLEAILRYTPVPGGPNPGKNVA